MNKKSIVQLGISVFAGLAMCISTLLLVSTVSAKGAERQLNRVRPGIASPKNITRPPRDIQAQAGGVVSVPVYVLVYGDPAGQGVSVQTLTEEIMQHLMTGTMHHGYKDPTATPYVQFGIHAIRFVTPTVMATTPKYFHAGHGKDVGDYHAMYYDNPYDNLCTLALEGKIKQVWIWADETGELQESVDNGPLWQDLRDTNVPNCGVQLTTLGYNWRVPVGNGIEDHIHRYESFFQDHFTDEFQYATTLPYSPPGPSNPPPGPPPCTRYWGWCVETQINDNASPFGFTAGAISSTGGVAQCGWAHYPPNITWEYRRNNPNPTGRDRPPAYTWDYTGTVRSQCEDWTPNGGRGYSDHQLCSLELRSGTEGSITKRFLPLVDAEYSRKWH